ncbi:hypothetical protein AAVH_10006 [Aphelenchoides avenae]|nr:hypothetical protein AAVH_10006 [Aphelenchus avenae]
MVAFCSMLHVNIVLLAIQFVWRNNLICGRDRQRAPTGPKSSHISDRVVLLPVVHGDLVLGVLKTRLHHAFYLLSGALSYVVIITCQIRVIRFMRSMGVPTHCATRRAHTEINRALVALAVTPLLGIIPTGIMISTAALGINNGPISAYMSIGMTIITLVNPLVAILFIRPYRNGFLRLLHIRRKYTVVYSIHVTPLTTTVAAGSLELATYYPTNVPRIVEPSGSNYQFAVLTSQDRDAMFEHH